MYGVTLRSRTSALQPASADQSCDGDFAVANSQVENQSEICYSITPELEGSVLIPSVSDHSHVWPATELDFNFQRNPYLNQESDPDFMEELELPTNVKNLDSDHFASDLSCFNSFSTHLPLSLTLDSVFSVPTDCLFHTPYLILQPLGNYPRAGLSSSSYSLTSPRSPFIQSYVSAGSIGRTFLLQNIQTYATQLSSTTLPPFIHSTAAAFSDLSRIRPYGLSLYDPLAICKSIVQLYIAKTDETSAFIWHTIKIERDRMISRLADSDEDAVLAMLQAITIYILLRVFDSDAFSVDFDRELVGAMTVR